MPNPTPQPVIRCPHAVRCNSKQGTDEVICKAFGAVKTEVVARGFCPEVVAKRHAQATAERFDDLSQPGDPTVVQPVFQHDAHATGGTTVEVDIHLDVTGDENG